MSTFPLSLVNLLPQNLTVLSNVFVMTFLTQLGFEGLKFIIGEFLP